MNRTKTIGRILAVAIVAVSLCFQAYPGRADIYRWQDEAGNWHFTDSPTSETPLQHPPEPSYQSSSHAPQITSPTPRRENTAAATPAPAGDRQGGGLLWRISRRGYRDSYLLGTIHSSDPRVVRLRPAVQGALRDADRFVMEMEMDASALTAFGTRMMLTGGDDLEKLLGAALYARVVAAMSGYGMPEPVVRTLKPWVVMALLSMPKPTGEPILDMVLHQRAAAAGKPTAGLETAEEQLAVFEGLSLADQIDLLEMTMAQSADLPRMFDQLISAYAADNLQRIAELADSYKGEGRTAALSRFRFRLNDQRNRRMAQRMQPYLAQGNSFIAVGAMHLVGKQGLIQLLRDRGYSVVPLR